MFQARYNQNALENVVIREVVSVYGENVYDRCFLDVSCSEHWVEFYLRQFKASLVTTINKDGLLSSCLERRYATVAPVDVLTSDLNDRIGIFEEQYDIVTAFGIVDTLVEDALWQKTLENFCFYLKPGGLLLVSGDFTSNNKSHANIKTRSKSLWAALLHNSHCTLDKMLIDEFFIGAVRGNVLVIRKNE